MLWRIIVLFMVAIGIVTCAREPHKVALGFPDEYELLVEIQRVLADAAKRDRSLQRQVEFDIRRQILPLAGEVRGGNSVASLTRLLEKVPRATSVAVNWKVTDQGRPSVTMEVCEGGVRRKWTVNEYGLLED